MFTNLLYEEIFKMEKKIPAYQKVYAQIRRDILDGNYKTGMLLPPEPELEKIFQVSRTTIRRAISMLQSEGYLKVKQGHGTEIIDISTIQKLNSLTSLPESLIEKGYKVTIQGDYIQKVIPPKYVNDALNQKEGSEVYKIEQIQCANKTPISIIVSFLAPDYIQGLENHSSKFVDLYKFLNTQYNIVLTTAVDNITAIKADFLDSQILQVPVGEPLLYNKRIGYLNDFAFECSIAKIIADRYEYRVHLEQKGYKV